MYLIFAFTLVRFYYGGNLHFNLELEPVRNRITLRDTLTLFSDLSEACQYKITQVLARQGVDPS